LILTGEKNNTTAQKEIDKIAPKVKASLLAPAILNLRVDKGLSDMRQNIGKINSLRIG